MGERSTVGISVHNIAITLLQSQPTTAYRTLSSRLLNISIWPRLETLQATPAQIRWVQHETPQGTRLTGWDAHSACYSLGVVRAVNHDPYSTADTPGGREPSVCDPGNLKEAGFACRQISA
jgi:hypothetical protein